MRSRYHVRDPRQTHFVTSTIVGWRPVFTTAACCDILVETFEFYRRERELQVYAWVIMEHHFHAIVAAPELSRVMSDFKKYTAKRLLAQLPLEGREWLVKEFEFHRAKHKTDSKHQVWQEGFHPQALPTDAMMEQKLGYLHNNPVRAGRVAAPEHWRYSSAHEWLGGAIPVMQCDAWR